MTFTDLQKQIIDNDRTIKYVRLEFPNREISDIESGQIYQEALSLEESLCEENNLQFGNCNGSILKVRVADFTEDIQNARMNVYITFTHADLGSVDVPFGKYIISQPPERTSDRRWRDITASDYMTLFDTDISEWYNITLFPTNDTVRTVKQAREMLYSYIGIQYEDTELINDGLEITKTLETNSLSGREFLEKLLEINGCFGHFSAEGILTHISLLQSPTAANTEQVTAFKGDCIYEDYNVESINSVEILDEDGNRSAYYRSQQVTENKYTVSNNYLLYGIDEEKLETVAENLLAHITNCIYRVNTVTVHGGIYISLGEAYTVYPVMYQGSQTIQNEYQSYCLSRTISGIQAIDTALKATGERYQVKSTDIVSDIATLRSRTEVVRREVEALQNKVEVYLLYDNAEGYEMRTSDQTERTIIEIPFLLDKKCYVIFHATIIFDITTDSGLDDETDLMVFNDGNIKLFYYINDELVSDFEPECTYQDGRYTIHIDFSWYDETVGITTEQSFKVKCKSTDCLMFIPINRIHGYLTASGLYLKSGWDGNIIIDDTIEKLDFEELVREMADTASASAMVQQGVLPIDSISAIRFTGIASITDTVTQEKEMIFTTTINTRLLTYTATITDNAFTNGDVVTPNISNIQSFSVVSNGGEFSVSFDGGTTWVAYVQGTGWITGTTMSKSEIEAVPTSAWTGTAMIKATLTSEQTLASITALGGNI